MARRCYGFAHPIVFTLTKYSECCLVRKLQRGETSSKIRRLGVHQDVLIQPPPGHSHLANCGRGCDARFESVAEKAVDYDQPTGLALPFHPACQLLTNWRPVSMLSPSVGQIGSPSSRMASDECHECHNGLVSSSVCEIQRG